MEDNDIECNDDAICLKAGRDADGLAREPAHGEDPHPAQHGARRARRAVTIGSETSGGIRDIEVERLTVMTGVPNGILFKSASTRGGMMQNIHIRNVEMQGVAHPISITMNWNPAYSYAKLPEGMKDIPDYWRCCWRRFRRRRGCRISATFIFPMSTATGAQQAFTVSAYPEAPLQDFEFKNIHIEAKTRGFHSERAELELHGRHYQNRRWQPRAVKNSSGRQRHSI